MVLRIPSTAAPCLLPLPVPNRAMAVTIAAAAVATTAVSLTLTAKSGGRPLLHPGPSAPLWASLSLDCDGSPNSSVNLPVKAAGGGCLFGVGLRVGLPKKSVFMPMSVFKLVSVDVYAFGVCADANDLEQQLEMYLKLREGAGLISGTQNSNTRMTAMLQTVSRPLSFCEIVSGIEKTAGGRLKKFLLESITSLSNDEHKLRKGSVIEIYRKSGNAIKISIDGEEVWSSEILWNSILYQNVEGSLYFKYAKNYIKVCIDRVLKGDE